MYVYICIYTHTCTHMYTYVHICTHMYTCVCVKFIWMSTVTLPSVPNMALAPPAPPGHLLRKLRDQMGDRAHRVIPRSISSVGRSLGPGSHGVQDTTGIRVTATFRSGELLDAQCVHTGTQDLRPWGHGGWIQSTLKHIEMPSEDEHPALQLSSPKFTSTLPSRVPDYVPLFSGSNS